MPQFVKDVEEIRQRAIDKIEDGAVTNAYGVDKERTIEILNEALATEIVCVLRYMHHYFMATGVHGKGVADEFKEHADAEREHADALAERIQQLGGKPDFNPKSLVQRSASQYIEGETLADMIREDLIAERVVIEVYTEMIRYFGDKDPTTRHMIEAILADEEEHASDLSDLLFVVDPRTGEDRGQDPGTDPLRLQSKPGSSQQRGANTGPRQQESRQDEEEGEEQMSGNQGNRQQQRGADEGAGKQRGNTQGMSNRAASEELQRGALKQAERGAGKKSLNSSKNRANQRDSGAQDTRRTRDDSEARPARATRSERPNAGRGGETEAAHQPGTGGRVKRQRSPEIDVEVGNVYPGEAAGASRAVRVTNASNKRKKVA